MGSAENYRKNALKAAANYRQKFDLVQLRIEKGEREKIKAAAAEAGETLNDYIIKAIKSRMNG